MRAREWCIVALSAAVLIVAPILTAHVYAELQEAQRAHVENAVAEVLAISDKAAPLELAEEAQAVEDELEAYYYEPAYYAPSYGGEAGDFMRAGVIYEGDTRFTWYSQRVLAGGGLTELNDNGRHVEDGFVKDADGYIAVASSDHEPGEIVETPFGEGKVYDTGCASGTIDIYTDF